MAKGCQVAPANEETLESWTSRLTLPAPPFVSLVVSAALTMGVPTFLFAVLVMLIVPMVDYAKCIRSRENVLLADLFMMIFAFSALNACLESFFFRRSDPVWLLFVSAAIGLRLTARIAIPSKA